jgi:NCS2 family nucleobase:cation symporter-2
MGSSNHEVISYHHCLLFGCIVSAIGYFNKTSIDDAPIVIFLLVKTFHLRIYGPTILSMIASNIAITMAAIGNITACCDVSTSAVEGQDYDSRTQGGISDGIGSLFSCLFTNAPLGNFSQKSGIISMTKCANRKVGYWCCFWLILMGIWAKFAAAFVVIPKAILGGMTIFQFSSVLVTGLAVTGKSQISKRDRSILSASMSLGYGSIMVSHWFSNLFTYYGTNDSLASFLNAITLMMNSQQAITAFTGIIVHLFIKERSNDEDFDSEVIIFQVRFS